MRTRTRTTLLPGPPNTPPRARALSRRAFPSQVHRFRLPGPPAAPLCARARCSHASPRTRAASRGAPGSCRSPWKRGGAGPSASTPTCRVLGRRPRRRCGTPGTEPGSLPGRQCARPAPRLLRCRRCGPGNPVLEAASPARLPTPDARLPPPFASRAGFSSFVALQGAPGKVSLEGSERGARKPTRRPLPPCPRLQYFCPEQEGCLP